METISIKLDDEFAKDVKKALKRYNYTTKTEFVRESMRIRLKDLAKEEALKRVNAMYGSLKYKRITNKRLHEAKERAFNEIDKEFK
ncbi:MAG TPA: ribbon-helix-helix domain-containing protein [Candidatus Nanoarchaeia archaeon]|nr:ribbon-helix-helix domain-containing protein [Candidatus Nanoarchaeia archaeon]